MNVFSADVSMLMPKIDQSTYERFRLRYSGLEHELAKRSLTSFFAESHTSYQADTNSFKGVFQADMTELASYGVSTVVRDLTMGLQDQPLHTSESKVVHTPSFNRFIADKREIFRRIPDLHPPTIELDHLSLHAAADLLEGDHMIIKPTTGQLSKGISIVTKTELDTLDLKPGTYLVQELLDTGVGVLDLGVKGVHNIRVISVGLKAVGAIVREGGSGARMLLDDVYGEVFSMDKLPDTMVRITEKVHESLATLPGAEQGVIAIDLMRGRDHTGNVRDVLCEINRRPMRISGYDALKTKNSDPDGIIWLANQWDTHEADMLAAAVSRQV